MDNSSTIKTKQSTIPSVTIIGAGLAGSECAWQLASRGIPVRLIEMRPVHSTPAHHTAEFAELVCSNSLRSDELSNAVGLLKAEMRRLDSIVLSSADHHRVAAGGALAVDRLAFSREITERLEKHPLVEVFVRELISAEEAEIHGFDDAGVFEGCMPVEVMARRGMDTLRYGPLKPVGLRNPRTGKEDYVLDDVFFWTMPQKDLEWAEVYWNHIRNNILSGHISEEYWWKGADKKKFHVRPKAQKSVDLAPTPDGKGAKKFCYWFNNDYVREIVENRRKEIING